MTGSPTGPRTSRAATTSASTSCSHDLTLVRDSMLADDDRLTADGGILRLIRTATAMGLGLATLDIREHSGKHHDALAGLFDRIGELDRPYGELDRAERKALLSREMACRRPLLGSEPARPAGRVRPPCWSCSAPSGRRWTPTDRT